jgi:hypothetical protein
MVRPYTHYFAPGTEFWFRWEGPEWLVVAQVPNPHVDEWKTIEIEDWETEMGGEVCWDELKVYAARYSHQEFERYCASKADPHDAAHGDDR